VTPGGARNIYSIFCVDLYLAVSWLDDHFGMVSYSAGCIIAHGRVILVEVQNYFITWTRQVQGCGFDY
jgi:hypothetical protein